MAIAETKLKVRTFISTHLRRQELTCDQDIFAQGLVNSLFAMQLVNFVERSSALQLSRMIWR